MAIVCAGRGLAASLALIALVLLARPAVSGEKPVVVGTAPVAGIYFPAGGAICNLVNRERARHGLRCLVESTGGSADNLARLRTGEIDFGIVQSDWQYLAAGDGPAPADRRFADLRAVLSLHALAVTLIAGPESGIETLDDLKSQRINLGPPGSGVRAVGEALFGALGWREGEFENIGDLGLEAQRRALCEGRIDAFLLPASHPNGTVASALSGCGAKLVEVSGPAVDRLLAEWPFYAIVSIPGGLYEGAPQPTRTYGVRATLVSSASVSADTVYELVRAVFENLSDLTGQHPALTGLSAEEMVAAGNTAPFHEGALRYFRERGWR